MAIPKRQRTVRFIDGNPTVTIKGEPRTIRKLISKGETNTKLRKTVNVDGMASVFESVKTFGLSLSPSRESGVVNTCAMASAGCAGGCLDHQGMASVFESIRISRIAKTVFYHSAKNRFLAMLRSELSNIVKQSERESFLPVVRLNVFSDIAWERFGIMSEFPSIQFYDYTKYPSRAGMVRPNYWVTFSRSETNENDCLSVLRSGGNVAIAFADSRKPYTGNKAQYQDLPSHWNGFPVINGDENDARFLDPMGGHVVGLRLKAHSKDERTKAIDSGFAVVH